MNIKSMRVRLYRSIAADEHVPEEAAERYRTLKAYDRLRAGGCAEEAALEQLGISRRTLHRWPSALAASGQRGLAPKSTRPHRLRRRAWKPRDVKAVLDVRRKYPLHVLPPRRPQWNGCVERANRSARAEFWSLYDGPLTVEHVAPQLSRYEFFFNYERPHASLAYRTPNEYLVALEAA